jgi:UPF0288 family protein (methanogenesis marker protein 3)
MCAKSIILNGKQVMLDPAIRTLRDAFEHSSAPYRDGHTVGLIKGREFLQTRARSELRLMSRADAFGCARMIFS